MSKKSVVLSVLALILFTLGDSRAQKTYTIASPDNNTVFTLTTSPRLMFSVAHLGTRVVEQSVIGLETRSRTPCFMGLGVADGLSMAHKHRTVL